MTLYNVPGTGYGELLINAGDGPTMIINRDETHQLMIGDDNSVASAGGQIDLIDPLSYIVYDGISTKFGLCNTPGITIQVDCVKGATSWAPSPAQAAQQISLLGLAKESTQQIVQTNTASTKTSVDSVKTTLGIPAQTADVNAVKTTLGTPAQTADVNAVKTTLGTPAQTADITAVNTTLGTPAQTSDITTVKTSVDSVKTTLGVPAQTADITAVKTTLGTPAQDGTVATGNAFTGAQSGPLKIPVALNANPFFTNPANGNAITTGYSAFPTGTTISPAGSGSVNALPIGSDHINGALLTPSGSTLAINTTCKPVTVDPGQFIQVSVQVFIPTTGGPYQVEISAAWHLNGANAGVPINKTFSQVESGWQRFSMFAFVPTNLGAGQISAFGQFNMTVAAGGNVPATALTYLTSFTVDSNVPGTHAGHTALAIANTGTPLLHGLGLIGAASNVNVPANTNGAGNANYTVTEPGYLITLSASMASAGTTNPFLGVAITWRDSGTGTVLAKELWWIPVAATGSTINIYGKGPTKGNQLNINFQNRDLTNNMTVSYTIEETTHHISRDDWRSDSPNNVVPGFGAGYDSDPFSLLLGGLPNVTIGVSGSVQYLLPLYSGQAWFYWQLTGVTSGGFVVSVENLDPNINTFIYNNNFTGNNTTNQPFAVPRIPVVVKFANNGSANVTVNWSVTALELAS